MHGLDVRRDHIGLSCQLDSGRQQTGSGSDCSWCNVGRTRKSSLHLALDKIEVAVSGVFSNHSVPAGEDRSIAANHVCH